MSLILGLKIPSIPEIAPSSVLESLPTSALENSVPKKPYISLPATQFFVASHWSRGNHFLCFSQ